MRNKRSRDCSCGKNILEEADVVNADDIKLCVAGVPDMMTSSEYYMLLQVVITVLLQTASHASIIDNEIHSDQNHQDNTQRSSEELSKTKYKLPLSRPISFSRKLWENEMGDTHNKRCLRRHERIAENSDPNQTSNGAIQNLNNSQETKNSALGGYFGNNVTMTIDEHRNYSKNVKLNRAIIAKMKQNPQKLRRLMKLKKAKAKFVKFFQEANPSQDMMKSDIQDLMPLMKGFMPVLQPIPLTNSQSIAPIPAYRKLMETPLETNTPLLEDEK
ncbi:hypothetical protein M8J76_011272 [Diaphorina citri]|nr:hypothetical protein M8J75_000872 [Diaphorina citri]KAI5745460.1 hypothetical protein M8J76_011272 [Diaphorina citri]